MRLIQNNITYLIVLIDKNNFNKVYFVIIV